MRRSGPTIQLCDERTCADLQAFLVDRLYEFNSQATGCFDAQLIGAQVRSDSGEIIGAFNGHTWGGCCVVEHLWVHTAQRGQGLGRALLEAAEGEAARRGCKQIVLSTHSFQSPGFYARLGYEQQAVIRDQPQGHTNIFFAKILKPRTAA